MYQQELAIFDLQISFTTCLERWVIYSFPRKVRKATYSSKRSANFLRELLYPTKWRNLDSFMSWLRICCFSNFLQPTTCHISQILSGNEIQIDNLTQLIEKSSESFLISILSSGKPDFLCEKIWFHSRSSRSIHEEEYFYKFHFHLQYSILYLWRIVQL